MMKNNAMAMEYNNNVENMRMVEYPMLNGKTYLDHGGTTLYARSLVESIAADLLSNLYGNPHSDSTPSALSSNKVHTIRLQALRFFNADPQHFDLIFVPNATAAIKLVMESFRDLAAETVNEGSPSRGRFWYGYHRDAHTSLVGVREVTHGLHRCFNSDAEVELWLDCQEAPGSRDNRKPGQLGLFAYPGQSNMTGRRLPLNWCAKLRTSPFGNTTYSLFDAAALATTCPISLADPSTSPDFTALSFYKVFGLPDLGALIVRKASAHVLQWRKYFGGGTVDMVMCIGESWHARKDFVADERYELHDQLEDGTLPFHSIVALGAALEIHKRLYGSMQDICNHTTYLSTHLYARLSILAHSNGCPIAHIYTSHQATYGDSTTQAATFAFNILTPTGNLIPYTLVERLADEQNIYVRSGGLCNPGGIATHLALAPWEMKRAWSTGHRCGKAMELVHGKATGVVRVSLGAMSTLQDVNIFLRFVEDTFRDWARASAEADGGLPAHTITSTAGATAMPSKETEATQQYLPHLDMRSIATSSITVVPNPTIHVDSSTPQLLQPQLPPNPPPLNPPLSPSSKRSLMMTTIPASSRLDCTLPSSPSSQKPKEGTGRMVRSGSWRFWQRSRYRSQRART